MWKDHPLGVGPGNFYQNINRYVPEYVMKDVHNTYIRCLTELGIQGIIVFGLLIGNAFLILRRVTRQATTLPGEAGRHLVHSAFTLRCALATLLTGCLAVSLTYVEYTWWFLLLPVCLDRALENAKADAAGEALEAALTLPKEGPHQHRLPKRLPRRLPKPASAPAGT
jgi:O-antigen ligase